DASDVPARPPTALEFPHRTCAFGRLLHVQVIMGSFLNAAEQMAVDCLCFRSRRVARLITRLYDEALRPLGLHATQLTRLNAIALSGREGGRMNALADVLALDGTTLSRNLRPLVAAGLVRLDRTPGDRRVRVAILTAAGQQMVADALPLWNEAHQRVLETLGRDAALALRSRLDETVAVLGPAALGHAQSDGVGLPPRRESAEASGDSSGQPSRVQVRG